MLSAGRDYFHHIAAHPERATSNAYVVSAVLNRNQLAQKTVAVAVRLVAKNSMLNDVAGEITRLLLTTRAKFAATLPLAGQIEAPDTDKKGVLHTHPGAAAYIDGTQESVFEQLMNQLFNLTIIGGILGSFGLWLHTFWRKHRPDEIQKNLARLPAMMREAKSLPVDKLSGIEEELDTLS